MNKNCIENKIKIPVICKYRQTEEKGKKAKLMFYRKTKKNPACNGFENYKDPFKNMFSKSKTQLSDYKFLIFRSFNLPEKLTFVIHFRIHFS